MLMRFLAGFYFLIAFLLFVYMAGKVPFTAAEMFLCAGTALIVSAGATLAVTVFIALPFGLLSRSRYPRRERQFGAFYKSD